MRAAEQFRPPLEWTRYFSDWLETTGCAAACSLYETYRLFPLGLATKGSSKLHERMVPRCQGRCADGAALWVGVQSHLWRFINTLAPAERTETGADRLDFQDGSRHANHVGVIPKTTTKSRHCPR